MKGENIEINVRRGRRQGRRDGVDLRSHEGIRRDQRRLPELIRRMILSGAMTITAPDLAPATAAERPLSVAVVRTMHDVLDCLIVAEAASPVYPGACSVGAG